MPGVQEVGFTGLHLGAVLSWDLQSLGLTAYGFRAFAFKKAGCEACSLGV